MTGSEPVAAVTGSCAAVLQSQWGPTQSEQGECVLMFPKGPLNPSLLVTCHPISCLPPKQPCHSGLSGCLSGLGRPAACLDRAVSDNTLLIPTVLEAGKSTIQVQSGEGFLIRGWPPRCVLTDRRDQGADPLHGGPTLLTSSPPKGLTF